MKQNLLIGIVAIVALVAGLYFSIVIAPPDVAEVKYLQKYPAARALPEFELYDQNDDLFSNQQLEGYWTLAFVGYTFCPDICPTTLAELKGIYPQLQAINSDYPIKIWFLSVDPKRDTAARLKEYINFFNSDFWATSGEHKQLFPLVRSMGMMYAMSDNTDDPNYLVDHSASITLINPKGEVVGRFKPTLEPGSIPVSEGSQIVEDMPIVVSM
ncbi:SCO family protein [Aliiglaciecola aliphaticivorans]